MHEKVFWPVSRIERMPQWDNSTKNWSPVPRQNQNKIGVGEVGKYSMKNLVLEKIF